MTAREHLKIGLGLNSLGHAYNDIYFFIIPLILPLLIKEFDLSYTYSGLIMTGHIGIRSLFSYISGHLGDKYDKRIIIATGFLISSLFLAYMVRANSISSVVICFFLMGIGVAAFHPLATAIAGNESYPGYRAFHIGIFETTGASGLVLASLTFGLAVQYLGWRETSFLLALPGIPLAWAYLRKKKEEIDQKSVAEVNVHRFYIMFFILARGIKALGIGVFISFLTVYGTDHLGLTPGIASWLMTIFFLGIMFGSLSGGWYADKTSPMLVILWSVIFTAPLMFIFTWINNLFLIYLLILILGVVNGSFFTVQNCWLTIVSTAKTRGRVLGMAFLIDGISVAIAPTIFGWIADYIGLAGSYRWTVLPVVLSLFFYFKLYNLQIRERLSIRVQA